MQLARYRLGDVEHWGALEGDRLARLTTTPFADDGPRIERTGGIDFLTDVRLLAPIPAVRPRIFGVGLNYVSHIAEAGMPTPMFPMLFMKPSTAAIGPGDPIPYPPEAEVLHFEAELAVVIGRRARRLGEAEALSAVLGCTAANDVSERVIQRAEMATGCLLIGKGYDGFCPIGPVITTGLDPANLMLKARVNGTERQSINTSDLLFSVAQLVAYLSRSVTLLPGDVIITGTPAGVGPVKPGDVVEIELEGAGVLRNPVVAEDAAPA